MIFSRFLQHLCFLAGGLLVSMYFLHRLPALAPHWPLSLIAIGVYTALSVFIYQWGKIAAAAANKLLFTQVSLAVVIIKMTISAAMVVIYQQVVAPQSRYYVLPFLLIYVVYTVYETWLLMKLGRANEN